MTQLTIEERQRLKELIGQNRKAVVRLRQAARAMSPDYCTPCFPEWEVRQALLAATHAALRLGIDVAVRRVSQTSL